MTYEQTIMRFGANSPEIEMLRNGTILAYGEVMMPMAYRVNTQVRFVDSENLSDGITLEVSGPGGSVDAGLSIVDSCRCARSQVRTIATGMVASMSAVLAICCAKPGNRYCTPNTTYMLHELLGGMQGNASDVIRTAKHMAGVRSRIESMLADASGLSLEEVLRLCRQGEQYLTAEDAKKLGLVDHIIEWK